MHLALAETDQERSRRFYERHFGFDAAPRRRYDGGVLIPDPAGYVVELAWEPR